jgi:hypothetical protein
MRTKTPLLFKEGCPKNEGGVVVTPSKFSRHILLQNQRLATFGKKWSEIKFRKRGCLNFIGLDKTT